MDAYGFDVMDWSGYPVMRDVRELLMVVWLAGSTRPAKIAEVVTELGTQLGVVETGSPCVRTIRLTR